MTIDIAVVSDANYVMPMAACVRSMLDNCDIDDELRVHVILDDVPKLDQIRLLESWQHEGNHRVEFYEHDQSKVADLPTDSKTYWSTATYARLFMADYFPSLSRIIYVDVDTLTFGSLAPLAGLDLSGCALAACRDPYTRTVSDPDGVQAWELMKLDPSTPYFNAGVLVADLEQWRRNSLKDAALDYLDRFGSLSRLMDQEALNSVLMGDFKDLPPEWNVLNYWEIPSSRTGENADIMERIRIRHFEGPKKPWTTERRVSPSQLAFFDYLDRTSWSGWRPPHLWNVNQANSL